MDPGHVKKDNATVPTKMRFAPKATQSRARKPVVPKKEEVEDADAIQAKDLLRRFAESSMARSRKTEKKVAPSQVAFGFGGESKTIRSFAPPKGSSSLSDNSGINSSGLGVEKEYKEPWDYYSYYPTAIPLRRPYSGDPELLDEEEFVGASEDSHCDEHLINQAMGLGLMEESLDQKLIYFQLPATLPTIKRPPMAVGQVTAGKSKQISGGKSLDGTSNLDDLPEGLMGKMLVYRSGAVKLKLGDTLYDVSAGSDCVFAQDAVAINTDKKQCCVLGEVTKRAIVTPDVDSILDNMENSDLQ